MRLTKTGRGRFIRTSLSTDARVIALHKEQGDWGVLLYLLLIAHSTDYACAIGNVEELRLTACPGFEKSNEDIVAALEAIERCGLIEHWDRDLEIIYLKSHSFYECQSFIRSERRRSPGELSATHTEIETRTSTPIPEERSLGGAGE